MIYMTLNICVQIFKLCSRKAKSFLQEPGLIYTYVPSQVLFLYMPLFLSFLFLFHRRECTISCRKLSVSGCLSITLCLTMAFFCRKLSVSGCLSFSLCVPVAFFCCKLCHWMFLHHSLLTDGVFL